MDIVGRDIGRYHIVEQLGRGGMATVFRGYDTLLERDVAIKFIRRDAFSPETFQSVLKRFEREAKALARLSHPNIVKVHDYGEYEGSPYLVMEYILGGALKPRQGIPMPYREAALLLIPVARALAYAHEHKIIHRDVKPANILLTEEGLPMLSDFGIAKILEQEETTALTGTGVGIGTPEYMSPEQGMGHGVDHRTDIYSLGVVLYELITGRKPFQADTPMAVVLKHITEPLPRPKSVVPDLPDRVEKVIFKALAKQPDERYQSMSAFASALEEIAHEKLPEATLTDEKVMADKILRKDQAAAPAQRVVERQPLPKPVSQPVPPIVSHPPALPARQTGVVSARRPAARKGAFPALGGMALIAALLFAGVLALAGLVYVLYGTQPLSQSQDRLATLVAQTETVFSLMRETDLAGTFTALTSTAQTQASLPATASPSPVMTVSNTPPPCSNQAAFVADVTIPDGTELPPYKDFVKTWRLKNDGTCIWTSGYQIVFDSGYQMGGPVSKMLTSADVHPGGTLDISVNLTAPSDAGTYRGNWCLQSANGERFGIGADATHCLYVQIKVVNPLTITSSSGGTSGGKPDLLITDITWAPDPPIKHTNTHVKVTVYNQGNAPATNFTVRWWGLETFANPSCEWNVASLVAHGGYVLECDFTFASHYAPMNTTAHVDDENNVIESDESNNKFKKVIDVN